MRTLLAVSYFFPPIGGTAVMRMLKFVKYLPESGWRCCVLSSAQGAYLASDDALLSEIPPGTRVERVRGRDLGPLIRTAGRAAALVRRVVPRPAPGGDNGKSTLGTGDGLRKDAPPRPGLSPIPDRFIGWYPAAVRAGLRLIREERPAAILSTSSPYTSHLVAMKLSERTGLPWVADFRDPWFFAEPDGPLTPRQRIEFRLERKVVSRARRVINVSEPWAGIQRRRHGAVTDPSKFVVVTNGYDEDDVAPVPERGVGGRIRLGYFGTLRDHRSPREFLIALHTVLGQCPELRKDLAVDFVGGMFDPPGVPPNSAVVERLGLGDVVHVRGYVPHGELKREMETVSGLLLIIGNYLHSEGTYSGKIFEYLATGIPIFAVVPDGVARDLIAEAGAGEPAPYGDSRGIAASLDVFLRRLREGSFYPVASRELLERFSRRTLARRLAALLNDVAPGAATRGPDVAD